MHAGDRQNRLLGCRFLSVACPDVGSNEDPLMVEQNHIQQLQAAHSHLTAGQLDQAFSTIVPILQADPNQPDALTILGRLQWMTGDRATAVASWRRATQRDPRQFEAATLLAEAALEAGSAQDAVMLAERVIRSGDPRPDPWMTLIRAQRQLGETNQVLATLEQATKRHGQDPDLLWHACVIASEGLQHRAAGTYAERLLAIQPGHAGATCTWADAKARASDWDDATGAEQRLRRVNGTGGPDPSLMDCAYTWDDPVVLAEATRRVAAANPVSVPRPRRQADRERLTVCYLSPDLREHPVARMLLGVLPHHDRAQVRLITAGLSPPADDTLARRVRGFADEHLDLCTLSDAEAIARLQQAGVDVLVDLAGATTRNRYGILAGRPAAAQILWLGCPTGTAGSWYDAYILDVVACPETSGQTFTEPLIRLPHCYHPILGADGVMPAVTRADAGLADDAIVLACPHTPHKVRPPVVDAWLRIALAEPRVVLWLDALDDAAKAGIRAYAADRGVSERQLCFWRFQPDHARYLATLALADLFLDNHPYGAHSTAGEALTLGLPVITPSGQCVHARVAASMLSTLGLHDCIRDGLDDYERHILRLCRDDQARAELTRRTRTQAALVVPGFGPRLAASLETVYRQVWATAPV